MDKVGNLKAAFTNQHRQPVQWIQALARLQLTSSKLANLVFSAGLSWLTLWKIHG